MPFVMSDARVREIRSLIEPARFTVTGVSVEFRTTEAFVASVLPPGFEPDDEPSGLVRISQMQSALCGEFSACSTVLNARFQKWRGQYCLSMLISGDMPVTIGRDFWGEVKKRATSHLHVDGSHTYGYGVRDGVRVAEIEIFDSDSRGPVTAASNALELKAWMSADGGLEAPPRVLVHEFTSHLDWLHEGKGELRLRNSAHDPLGEIPIVQLGQGRHYSGETVYRVLASVELDQDERYLPYIYGRAFDDLTRYPVAARFRQAGRAGRAA